MEYLKSGKDSDWLKYQLSRSQVYLKPTTFIKLSRREECVVHLAHQIRPGDCKAIQRT